jgi:SAM-dependent methyltransferase
MDLGCGTGIDAAHFGQLGYSVTGIDNSREMVSQARKRIERAKLTGQVRIENLGAEYLGRLGSEVFDAIYSNLGPLNCVADLHWLAGQCATHLKPRGYLIVSVMARICPWEIVYFTMRGDFAQAERRLSRKMVPVKLENGVVWTRYYSPDEFLRLFANEFRLVGYRALNVILPPPYLVHWYRRARGLGKLMRRLDVRASTLPVLRDMGDHFLMVLQKAEGGR